MDAPPLSTPEAVVDAEARSSASESMSNKAAAEDVDALRKNVQMEVFPMTEAKAPYIPQIAVPETVLRGSSMGYTSQLDRRAWLEVLDPKHRYAKNLRAYFKAWDLLGKPGGEFLDWLDSGSLELEHCPRKVLDGDTVHYCTDEQERETYRLAIETDGRIRLASQSAGTYLTTGPNGWIFVLRDGLLYAHEKRTVPPRFHHSTFFAGECVEVAGLLVVTEGRLGRLYPHSGHYRPQERHVQHLLRFLEKSNIELDSLEVDAQHTMKVARLLAREGSRVKKKDSPHFIRGDTLLHFLELKSTAWSTPLFEELKSVRGKARHEWADTSASAEGELGAADGGEHGLGLGLGLGGKMWDCTATMRPSAAEARQINATISNSRGVGGHPSSWNGDRRGKGLASYFSASQDERMGDEGDECFQQQLSGSASSSLGDPTPPPIRHDELFLDLAASPHQIRSVSSSVYEYAADEAADKGDEDGTQLFPLDE